MLPLTEEAVFHADNYIYLKFKARKGDIIIVLDNSGNAYGFSYNLILTSTDINILHPESQYFSSLNVHKTLYYQMIVEHEEKIIIELLQCSGKNKLFVS